MDCHGDSERLFVSIITFGEIRFCIELLPASKRWTDLEQWLQNDLHLWFAGRLLAVDESIVSRWALLMAARQLQRKPLDILDGFLAATALHHNLALVTRNVKDFGELGVGIVNPWES